MVFLQNMKMKKAKKEEKRNKAKGKKSSESVIPGINEAFVRETFRRIRSFLKDPLKLFIQRFTASI